MSASRILLVGGDRDLLDLLEGALGLSDHQIETTPGFEAALARLSEQRPGDRPDLIIVQVRSAFAPSVEFLDHLLRNPDLRSLPILTLATLEGDCVLAEARFNVHGCLLMPFDLDDLLTVIEQAIRLERIPPPPAPATFGPGMLARANDVLTQEQPAIVLRWAQRVIGEHLYPPGRINVRTLVDHVPLLIKALLASWAPDGPPVPDLFRPNTELWVAVTEIVRGRRRVGASVATIIREYELLRNEIWSAFRQKLSGLTAEDVFLLEVKVNRTLDGLLRLILTTYEEQQARE